MFILIYHTDWCKKRNAFLLITLPSNNLRLTDVYFNTFLNNKFWNSYHMKQNHSQSYCFRAGSTTSHSFYTYLDTWKKEKLYEYCIDIKLCTYKLKNLFILNVNTQVFQTSLWKHCMCIYIPIQNWRIPKI